MSSKASNPSPNCSFSGNDDSKIEISKDSADEIWKYGISLDGEDVIQCKFCDDVITGGLYRFLCHLAGTEHGSEGCGGGGDDDDDEEEEKGCTCVGVSEKRTRDDLVSGSSEDVFKNIEIPKDFADKIWKYGISLDGEDAIQCKFCDDVITGGLYWFLYHLAGTVHGGEGCEGGGDDEEEKGFTCAGVGEKRKEDDLVGGSSEDVFKNLEIPKEFADKIWEYGISLDGEDAIQCKFCDDVITGGLYRFLFHLAGTEHGGEGYGGGCDEEEEKGCTCVGVGEKRKGGEVDGDGNSEDVFIFKKSRDGSKDKRMEILKEEADQAIARFFYNNGIPLKVVESKSFIAMVDMISRCGVGFEPPSVEDLRGKYLMENVRLMNEALEEHRSVWKKTGCSIMVDGWTDKKKRSILNLLVNSLKGTFFLKSVDASDMLESPEKLFKMMDDIVEEVGEDNVVQIVTDVTPYYKAAGEMLMEKRTRLYWTPCATHCIEMMLNDYEKIPIYEEIITKGKKITTFIYSRSSLITLLHKFTKGVGLVRQGITRCVTSYLTLGRLYEKKEALRKMFTSKEWTSSQFAKTSVGKYAEDVVLDKVFWENVMICLNGANPLVDVLRLVNSIDEPATGFIYKAKEQAKEEIRRSLSKGGTESFVPLWEIIDERWDKQLHSPLHAAGYFLNPQIHYRPGFRDDIKVKDGLHHCIARMVADPEERAKIETQLDVFNKQANILGHPLAVMTVGDEIPSNWWSTFGDGLPELQKFACRVLSLTCSSYGDLRNQRAFKMVHHAKKRNLLRQKTHNDVVFVMANIKLAEKKEAGGPVELNLDGNGENEGLDVDFGTSYMKSLNDMISDLHDEYAGVDEDGDGDENEYEDEDEDGDDDLKSLYDVISDLHDLYGNGDEDEYGDEDGDEDEYEDGDEDQMEDSD